MRIDDLAVAAGAVDGDLVVERRSDSAITWSTATTGPLTTTVEIARLTVPGVRGFGGFTSGWGLEFEPVALAVDVPVVWEVTSGRSGNGAVPWLGVTTETGSLVLTIHWSGNWRFEIVPDDTGHRITVGLRAEGQQAAVTGGERFTSPAVTIAVADTLPEASATLVDHLADTIPLSAPGLLTEWNHWWPYEDAEIDEDTFLANAALAADLGLDVAVLDAGWFGRSEAGSDWFEERGDWHLVNEARFPHGLAWLADRTRAHGIDFGIWIEAEAIGRGAGIAGQRPEILARDAAGASLGYVCLGAPAGRTHVRDQVAQLITTTAARWIKWDFNLDPGDGCACDDHGHRGDDGLLRHYLGLYAVLDDLRAAYPDTIFEACSSGGLRIDAGLGAHVDGFFLSDPDWTEHHLACLWGAARLLSPRQILHWPQSEWRGEHRFQHVDYSGTLITRAAFDTKIRAAMLHRFGISVRLTDMRPDLLARLKSHVDAYGRWLRPLLGQGILRPLTDQPLREEKGCRLPVFQLSSGADRVLAAFRLAPAPGWEPARPVGLDPDAAYEVIALPDGTGSVVAGRTLLADGLVPEAAETSALWSIRPVSGGGE